MPYDRNFLLCLLALTFITVGCSGSHHKKAPGHDDHLRFIFITTVVGEEFFIPVEKGMADAARMMGVSCEFVGTEGVDIPAQAEMVRQAVRDGYDGIALNIIDDRGFDAVVQEAMDAGIPVVAFDVDDHATPNARLSSVNQQFYEAGKKLGAKAASSIPDGSEILMTMHAAGVSALNDRLRGVQDGLREAGKNGVTWKVVITGNSGAESAEIIAHEFQANPNIKTILCTGQADTEGAGMVIKEHYPGQGYYAAGFDLSPEILQNVMDGHIAFTIDQQPYIQGFYPVIQLTLYKRYGIMPASMDAGATPITQDQAGSILELTKQHYR